MAEWILREGAAADGPSLPRLMAQLGYEVTADEVTRRIARMSGTTSDRLFVAVMAEQVVGFVAVHWLDLFHRADRLGRITALAVDERARGQGIGKALVTKAEQVLIAAGCGRIEVTSQARRTDAHAFYEALGYASGSKRFLKNV